MLDGINKDFYCSAGRYHSEGCCLGAGCRCSQGFTCPAYHRKHPTSEQYKEEYGEEVPDYLPMWVWLKDKQNGDGWGLVEAHNIKLIKKTHEPLFLGDIEISEDASAVCACTPFPRPDMDWRP